jgi:hypothetical protein
MTIYWGTMLPVYSCCTSGWVSEWGREWVSVCWFTLLLFAAERWKLLLSGAHCKSNHHSYVHAVVCLYLSYKANPGSEHHQCLLQSNSVFLCFEYSCLPSAQFAYVHSFSGQPYAIIGCCMRTDASPSFTDRIQVFPVSINNNNNVVSLVSTSVALVYQLLNISVDPGIVYPLKVFIAVVCDVFGSMWK